jgi:hypothetical protein
MQLIVRLIPISLRKFCKIPRKKLNVLATGILVAPQEPSRACKQHTGCEDVDSFIQLRTGHIAGCCESSNEHLVSMKDEEFLYYIAISFS